MTEPLIPLAGLSKITVWGPNGEQLSLDDPEVEHIGIRRCTGGCGKVKLLTAFDSAQPGFWCRDCRNCYYREHYDDSPEARAERAAKHRAWLSQGGNRDKVNADVRRNRKQNPEPFRRRHTRANFRLTDAEIDQKLAAQDGVCAICRNPCRTGRNLGVDHDHDCCPDKGKSCGRCVRGFLCVDCNSGLGWFHDDPILMLRATVYLLRWRREHGKASQRDLLLLKAVEGVLADMG